MAECETSSSELYYTTLDTLMNSLHISSTPTLEPSRCNNSFRRHFHSIDESKFFSFCSTIKQYSKSNNASKDKCESIKQRNDDNKTTTTNVREETPKRSVTTTRKLKLFEDTERTEEFKEKQLSPKRLLLKKAITRLECMERRQERMALSKKPVRTSLRV